MRKVLKIAIREIKEYISSPVAYIILGVFTLICGAYFSRYVFVDNQASLRKLFEFIPLIWVVFIPALTMKSFSEELKTGTFEVLMTFPLNKNHIIFGKYLVNIILIVLMLGLTIPSFFTISYLGSPDFGQIIAAYFGLLLLGSVYIFIGMSISIRTKNQIVAYILSAFVILILYGIGEEQVLNIVPVRFREYFEMLGLGSHYRSIARGVIDSRDIIYYFTVLLMGYLFTYISFNRIQNKGK